MKIALAAVMAFLLQTENRGTIQGRTVRAETGEPVVGARIVVTKVGGRLSDSRASVTDNRGRFEIRDVPAGTYRIFADSDDSVRRENSTPVTITAGQQVSDLVFSLVPTSVITGRVTDQNNEPVSRIYVRATDADKKVYETQSNDLGEYRLFGLPPGNYTLTITRYIGPFIDGVTYVVPTPPRLDSLGEGRGMINLANHLGRGAYIDPRALKPAAPPDIRPLSVELPPGAILNGIDFRY
jgi:hypothetical protein